VLCPQGHGRCIGWIDWTAPDTSLVGTVGEYVPPDPDNPPISQFFTVQLIR
jgi:hypothetical protein